VGALPDQLSEFSARLVASLRAEVGDALVGVYLHGSAALGDWVASRSDVDVLVVVASGDAAAYAEVLAAAQGYCPGTGLEASVVDAAAALAPSVPWPFVVHVAGEKAVFGATHGGDEDLILHYAVTRDHGVAAYGPDPRSAFGRVAPEVIAGQIARELRWALAHASETYAVLNACRALRFAREGVLCSKRAGGEWAIEHDIAVPLARRALAHRGRDATRRERRE
jgi:streptomycin 3"-adenylyltransferase